MATPYNTNSRNSSSFMPKDSERNGHMAATQKQTTLHTGAMHGAMATFNTKATLTAVAGANRLPQQTAKQPTRQKPLQQPSAKPSQVQLQPSKAQQQLIKPRQQLARPDRLEQQPARPTRLQQQTAGPQQQPARLDRLQQQSAKSKRLRQQRFAHPSLYPKDIPDTDPQRLSILWNAVRNLRMNRSDKALRPTASASSRQRGGSAARGGHTVATGRTPKTIPEALVENESTIHPRDGHSFREFALKPRGITFGTPVLNNAARHFSDIFRKENFTSCYANSKVWLSDDEFDAYSIAEWYKIAQHQQQHEDYFNHLFDYHLFRYDVPIHPDEESATILSSYAPQWGPVPSPLGPPIVNPLLPSKSFTFNLKLDKTFFLSTHMFPADFRRKLNHTHLVAKRGAACAYLTYDMKRSPDTLPIEAENRIAAASVLWLHKRCELRKLAKASREKQSEEFDSEGQSEGLKHYGITICGHLWFIWVTEPTSESGPQEQMPYSRYTVTNIGYGTFDRANEVKDYVDWQNWIHYWGLGPYMRALVDDLKELIAREKRMVGEARRGTGSVQEKICATFDGLKANWEE